eukprot:4517739-Prymnesium_polylepis.1
MEGESQSPTRRGDCRLWGPSARTHARPARLALCVCGVPRAVPVRGAWTRPIPVWRGCRGYASSRRGRATWARLSRARCAGSSPCRSAG